MSAALRETLAVRHGQASFGAANYDALSARGRRQSALLGDWLAQHYPEGFAQVYCGDMQRHRDTLREIELAFVEHGIALPAPHVLPGLNEFDHRAVIAAYTEHHADPGLVRAAQADGASDRIAVFRLLRASLLHWASGALDAHVPEAWSTFKRRVCDTAQALADDARPGVRLIVSSGGPLAQLAGISLDLDDPRRVALNLAIRNSALCEFRAGAEGWQLLSWNTLPHLAAHEHRELWTHY
jgi:broad specificity phosphatase PhoE